MREEVLNRLYQDASVPRLYRPFRFPYGDKGGENRDEIQKYLKKNGFNEKSQYNQVANYAYLDTNVNISIGARAPRDYFSEALRQCGGEERKVGTILEKIELEDNLRANSIPVGIDNMSAEHYFEFLQQRRVLMAQKIKAYYRAL